MLEICLCGHSRKAHYAQTEYCKVCESCPEFVHDDQEAMFADKDTASEGD